MRKSGSVVYAGEEGDEAAEGAAGHAGTVEAGVAAAPSLVVASAAGVGVVGECCCCGRVMGGDGVGLSVAAAVCDGEEKVSRRLLVSWHAALPCTAPLLAPAGSSPLLRAGPLPPPASPTNLPAASATGSFPLLLLLLLLPSACHASLAPRGGGTSLAVLPAALGPLATLPASPSALPLAAGRAAAHAVAAAAAAATAVGAVLDATSGAPAAAAVTSWLVPAPPSRSAGPTGTKS